jgi:15-cis-phytoene synthase
MNAQDAYARCEQITRLEAKNFAYGIRLLPGPKRRALSAVYALARRIDDVGDGDMAVDQKFAHLARIRADLEHLDLTADDPVLWAIRDVAGRYPLPLDAFDELIQGCEIDCSHAPIETFDQLVAYCRLVAGSIGRLSLAIFGAAEMKIAARRADALGVALQLTNILRDIVEDRDCMGRVYLPREDLEAFGCSPDLAGSRRNLSALISFEAERAKSWYEEGLSLLPLLDRRSRACVATMAGIYRRVLTRIESDPVRTLESRVSLSTREKVAVAARSLAVGKV